MTPCLSRSLRFAQIDDGDVWIGRAAPWPPRPIMPSPCAAISSCVRPTWTLAGTATSIIFGLGRFRLFISVDIFVDRFHLEARVVTASPRRWSTPCRPCSRGPDRPASRQAASEACRRSNSYCARGSPFWKSVRPVPRMSSVSPVKTRSATRTNRNRRCGRACTARRGARPSISMRSPSATRIDTTSALVCSPITVMQWVRSRSAPKPGDVIGMQMGIDRLDQLEVELADELQIAIHPLQHRIDDQRLATVAAGEQIGVGAGRGVEQLAEDHGRFLLPLGPILGQSSPRNTRK